MSEMIERVARAIEKAHPTTDCHRMAHAAITAMREPTEEMMLAGERCIDEPFDSPAYAAWRAMIDAALNEMTPLQKRMNSGGPFGGEDVTEPKQPE